MTTYTPRGGSLKPVKHEGPSGPFWVIHDDHGEYDGPWKNEAEAWSYIHESEKFNREARERYAKRGSL